jgi:hypothetical protein
MEHRESGRQASGGEAEKVESGMEATGETREGD